jgi:CheY-like chemotaxis protein
MLGCRQRCRGFGLAEEKRVSTFVLNPIPNVTMYPTVSHCVLSVKADLVSPIRYWQGEAESDESAQGSNTDTPDPTIKASAAPKHELDLILMDIEMPIMDGLACSRAIRDYENRGLLAAPQKHSQLPPTIIGPLSPSSAPVNHSATSTPLPAFPDFIPASSRPTSPAPAPKRRIPILAVSANARSEQVKHALAAGMDDAIAKPFRIRELRPKMENLVERLKG